MLRTTGTSNGGVGTECSLAGDKSIALGHLRDLCHRRIRFATGTYWRVLGEVCLLPIEFHHNVVWTSRKQGDGDCYRKEGGRFHTQNRT